MVENAPKQMAEDCCSLDDNSPTGQMPEDAARDDHRPARDIPLAWSSDAVFILRGKSIVAESNTPLRNGNETGASEPPNRTSRDSGVPHLQKAGAFRHDSCAEPLG